MGTEFTGKTVVVEFVGGAGCGTEDLLEATVSLGSGAGSHGNEAASGLWFGAFRYLLMVE